MTANPVSHIDHYTVADGSRLAARRWDVSGAGASIVLLHGIISHGGWYRLTCRHLASSGFDVHFVDRRGSGLNANGRGDVDAYPTWLDDVERYLASLPLDTPRLLLGISWGGKLAAAVARRRPDLVDGLGLVCPGLFARRGAGTFQRALLRIARNTPLRRSRVTIPLQDPALFTDNPHWQSYIQTDPLTLRQVTIRLAAADLQLSRYATDAPGEIRAPTLCLLAGRDRIIDNAGVRRYFDQLGTADRELIVYEDAAHTLEFETAPLQYLDDLAQWVRKVIS